MSDVQLRELYQEIILDHNKAPRNYGKLDKPSHQAEGFNPLCGDHYTIYLTVENGVITAASFEGAGCAISKASASLMTTTVIGKTVEEAESIFDNYRAMIVGHDASAAEKVGKLKVFSEVGNYPTRIKCAVLAWHAMHAALNGQQEVVTTE